MSVCTFVRKNQTNNEITSNFTIDFNCDPKYLNKLATITNTFFNWIDWGT